MFKQKSKTLISVKRASLLVIPVIVVVSSLLVYFGRPDKAEAATNGTINFQARLLTAAGQVVPDGNYNVEFKLYSALTIDGGQTPDQGACTVNSNAEADEDCLWVETRTGGNRVRTVNGYLTVNLGSVTAFGNLNWDQEMWLTMNIGGTSATTPTWDGEMDPRLKLTAVPYAFRAGTLVGGTGANTTTLTTGTPSGNHTIDLPAETGTVCLQSSASCGFATGTAANYIQNQNASSQTTANFWISGTGRADTALQAPLLDTATAADLNIGTTNATGIKLNQNTTIASGKTLTVTSGATSLTGATTGDALTVSNSTSTGNIAVFKDNTTTVLTIADGGATTFSNSVNSTTALKVVSSNGSDVLSINTTSSGSVLKLGRTGTPAHVGTALAEVYDATSSGNRSFTFDRTVPVGHSLVGTLVLSASATTTVTISDSAGHTSTDYTINASAANGSTVAIYTFSLNVANQIDAGDTMTISLVSGTGRWVLDVEEFGNLVWPSAADQSATNTGNSTSLSSGTTSATSQANELVFAGFAFNSDKAFTAGSGFVASSQISTNGGSNDRALVNEWKYVSSTGTQSAAGTLDTAGAYAAAIVTYKTSSLDSGALPGSIAFADKGGNSYQTTLGTVALSADRSILLPDESGTICIQSSTNCGFAAASGSANYIQNQSATPQAANFYIQSAANGTVGAIIRGASGQTSSLLQLLDGATGYSVAQFTNNGYLHLGSDSISRTGQIVFHDGTISNSNTITLIAPAAINTASKTITLPDETGTVCLQSSTACGFAAGSGDGDYIQNQNAAQQSSSNFWISGSGRADTSVLTPAIDVAAAGTLSVGDATATTINIGRGSDVARTINIGTAGSTTAQAITIGSTGSTSSTTIQGGTGATAINLTTGTNGSVNINTAGTGDIKLTSTDTIIAKATANFQIQNASDSPLFYADTANGRVGVGGQATSSKFEVIGGDAAVYNNGANPRLVLGDSTSVGEYAYLQWDSTNNYFRIESAGTNGLKINDNYLTIGNLSPDQPLKVANGTTLLMQVNTSGVVSVQGGQTVDITTTGGASVNNLTIAPGTETAASGTGANLALQGGNQSGATSTGGNVSIQAGTGTSTNGTINIGTANTAAISLGATGITATVNGNLTVSETTSLEGDLTIGNATTDRLTVTSQIQGQDALVFQGATDNGNVTTFRITNPTNANNIITFPDASGTVALNPANGYFLQQVPTSNSAGAQGANVISPNDNGIVGLTVNGTSGTAATALAVSQPGAAAGITVASANNTATNGLSFSGTFTNLINATNFTVSNAGVITVQGGQTADITNTSGNLTLQAATTNSLVLNTAGAGTVALGDTNSTTINIGRGSDIARTINIGTGGSTTAQLVNIGSTNATSIVTLQGTVRVSSLASVTSNSAAVCRDTSTTNLTACDGTNTTGRPFLQTGNSFGATAVLGTNDSNSLQFETNNTVRATFDTSNVLYLGNGTISASPAAFTVQGTNSSASGVAGGSLTLQGGNATAGNANGGAVTITGGTGFGTGARGLVVIDTPTVATTTTDGNCGATTAVNCTIASATVDNTSSVLVGATASVTISMPDPSIATAGRIFYFTAANGSTDFTLALNSGGTLITISMRANSTATLIWNGSDWTAAGASSSTTLQSAYDSTLSSAGGAEIVLNNTSTSNGLTVRNNATNPIIGGGLLEVQTSIGSNLFTVNNNASDYASNGGAETAGATSSTFPAGTWSAAPAGGSISRYTTAGSNIATGAASTFVDTTSTANTGVKNTLSASLTQNLKYKVSYTVRHTSSSASFTTLDTIYSADGTSSTATCASGSTAAYSVWTRIDCTFTATSVGASNAIIIRHSDSVEHDFYIDNLSVTVSADVNHAVDGSADNAANIGGGTLNWAAVSSSTVTQTTSVLYDSAGAVSVATSAVAGRGVYNRLTNNIAPAANTQYRVAFYARGNGNTANLAVAYTPDNGTNSVSCLDYNTQTAQASAYTLISCYFTTDATSVSNAQVRITQTGGSATTFYVDALTVTLNTNTASNVQVGGANKGGPTTLFTLDRSSSAPIAANNDAYLGSMYYDTVTGRIQCYESDGWGACGAAPDTTIVYTPEYTGAVLNGSGIGTMTADFCSNESGVLQVNTSFCANHISRNYYRWTSPQNTPQTYSIYVSYKLPSTFKAFNDDGTINLTALSDDTTNASVSYEVFRSSGSTISRCYNGTNNETQVTSVDDTWQTVPINGNEATGCSFTAGDNVIFKINMTADSNASVYVENLTFTYTNK